MPLDLNKVFLAWLIVFLTRSYLLYGNHQLKFEYYHNFNVHSTMHKIDLSWTPLWMFLLLSLTLIKCHLVSYVLVK